MLGGQLVTVGQAEELEVPRVHLLCVDLYLPMQLHTGKIQTRGYDPAILRLHNSRVLTVIFQASGEYLPEHLLPQEVRRFLPESWFHLSDEGVSMRKGRAR